MFKTRLRLDRRATSVRSCDCRACVVRESHRRVVAPSHGGCVAVESQSRRSRNRYLTVTSPVHLQWDLLYTCERSSATSSRRASARGSLRGPCPPPVRTVPQKYHQNVLQSPRHKQLNTQLHVPYNRVYWGARRGNLAAHNARKPFGAPNPAEEAHSAPKPSKNTEHYSSAV